MSKQRFLTILLMLCLSVALISVAPAAAQGEKVLHLALQEGDANSLDPQALQTLGEGQILGNIYEGLVIYDPKTLQPVPGVAEKYEVSDDGLTYTFHIRQGAKFSNGRQVTADDVVYTFNRLTNPKVATTYAVSLIIGSVEGYADAMAGKATTLSGVTAIDPQTAQIKLTAPNSAFLPTLTMVQASIIPKEAADDAATFAEKPVGTGPFILKTWERQQQITLVANPDYWRGKPAVDSVIMRVIPEKSVALVEYLAGNLDFVVVPPPDLTRLKADPATASQIQDQAILSTFWLPLNLNQKPLDNLKVRQALTFAVDRQAIVDSVLQGQGVVAHGPLPPGLSAYDPSYNPTPFDIQKAKDLLTEAGYPDGVDVVIRTWTDEVEARTLTAVQASWAQAGIRATFNRTEYTAYINDLSTCNLMIGTSSWTADYADADNFINPLPLSDLSTQGKNCGYGQVPQVKDAALKALTLPLGAERDALYRQAEKDAVENALGVFLYHRGVSLAVSPKIQGAYMDGYNIVKLFPISFTS